MLTMYVAQSAPFKSMCLRVTDSDRFLHEPISRTPPPARPNTPYPSGRKVYHSIAHSTLFQEADGRMICLSDHTYLNATQM